MVDAGRGTLGLLVRRAGFSGIFALSCSHVLAFAGFLPQGTPIEQPVDRLGVLSTLQIGTLSDVFTRISSDELNTEDMALAQLTVKGCNPAYLTSNQILTSVSRLRAEDVLTGTRTVLRGIKTPGAFGSVLPYKKEYHFEGYPVVDRAKFTGLVRYETACAKGDSGAPVVALDTNVVLGIHIGGEPDQSVGYFAPVGAFFDRYGLELLTVPVS